MTLDLQHFSAKLRELRSQFGVSLDQLAADTGLPLDTVQELDSGAREPTGDQVLILADFFRCDFKYFISNESKTALDRSRALFRRLGDKVTSADRWAIQEFLYLCECEREFEELLGRRAPAVPPVDKHGSYFKRHGIDAADVARSALGLGVDEVPVDVFASSRHLGVRLFRRRLESREISGLYVLHPRAGPCVLVNYVEDPFRQRFTAAHELGHALLDASEEIVVSGTWTEHELVETRANAFASEFLLPANLVKRLPDPSPWTVQELASWAARLFVNAKTLQIALDRGGRLSPDAKSRLTAARVAREDKKDVELPASLAPGQRAKRVRLLEHGLSSAYVRTVFECYTRELISAARAAEAMLCDTRDLPELAAAFGEAMPDGA